MIATSNVGMEHGQMLFTGDQSSKFFTPEPERESVKVDMSGKKDDVVKPMSFVEKNDIKFGGKAISEMETDLPTVETQFDNGQMSTPQRITMADLDSRNPDSQFSKTNPDSKREEYEFRSSKQKSEFQSNLRNYEPIQSEL